MRFRKFKGMVYPKLALTYDDSLRVMERKNIWMVEYLRARRCDPTTKGFWRRKYFAEPTTQQDTDTQGPE